MVLRAVGRALERLNRALLERFPEEWVAVGSEGVVQGLTLLPVIAFQLLLLRDFNPAVVGKYFAALGLGYLLLLLLDLGQIPLLLREVMSNSSAFPKLVNLALFVSLFSALVSALLTELSLFPFLFATFFLPQLITAYHNIGEYMKRQAFEVGLSWGKLFLLIAAKALGAANPFPVLGGLGLLALPYLKYINPTEAFQLLMKAKVKEGGGLRMVSLLNTLQHSADSTVLSIFLPPSAVAVYNSILWVSRRIVLLGGRLVQALTPVVVRKDVGWGLAKGALISLSALYTLYAVLEITTGHSLLKLLFPNHAAYLESLGETVSTLELLSIAGVGVFLLSKLAFQRLLASKAYLRIGKCSLAASVLLLTLWTGLTLKGAGMVDVYGATVASGAAFILMCHLLPRSSKHREGGGSGG